MKNLTMVCAILFAALFGTACFAKDTQSDLQKHAKMTKEQATTIGLAKVPNGAVKEAELEKEKGKLVWSFDIATPRYEGHHRSIG